MSDSFEADLEIDHIVAGGDGLARHEGLVVFVPRTLAGERVRARVALRGRLGRGTLVSIERASSQRVEPPCRHYVVDECGGCQLQHAAYDTQLEAKARIVVQAFRRIARMDIPVPEVRAAREPWRYRDKLTLAIRRIGANWFAGLRRYDAPDSVFPLHDCLITNPPVLAVWRDVMAASECFPAARELRGAVRVLDDGSASFSLEGGESWPRVRAFFERVPALRSVWWTPARGKRQRVATRETEGELRPDASFAQVNTSTATDLVAHVLERVHAHHPSHVIDAYAGSGSTAHPLDRDGVRVSAIELDPDAARWAERSLSPASRVIVDRVERVLEQLLPADVVILNPPRTGVDKAVCDAVLKVSPHPRSLVYVSCDPATLARDVARLPGWRIGSMVCFDMFPQTAHVETVCELLPEVA